MVVPQTEVESVHLMTMDEIFRRVEAGDQFTPDSLVAAKKYIEHRKNQAAQASQTHCPCAGHCH